ncbi:MAG TPA: Hpt domain-containing protein [Steroidobacteraceae bacterium]|nr:Hpt domain-containing protein [Steroidobacteraceae bacterium]
MQNLRSKFLARTRDEVETFRALISQWQAGAQGTLTEIERLAHRIHGTGATLGFDEVSESAAALERTARRLAMSGLASAAADAFDGLTPRGVRDLQLCTEQLGREVESAASRS